MDICMWVFMCCWWLSELERFLFSASLDVVKLSGKSSLSVYFYAKTTQRAGPAWTLKIWSRWRQGPRTVKKKTWGSEDTGHSSPGGGAGQLNTLRRADQSSLKHEVVSLVRNWSSYIFSLSIYIYVYIYIERERIWENKIFIGCASKEGCRALIRLHGVRTTRLSMEDDDLRWLSITGSCLGFLLSSRKSHT